MSHPAPATLPAPRILVLRPGAIGDTLLTYPALLALRERFPRAVLHLIGNPVAVPLLAAQHGSDGTPLMERWTPFDDRSTTGLFVPGGPPEHTIHAFGLLTAAVAWCSDPDGVLAATLRQLGADSVVIAPSRPGPEAGIHVADHLLATLRSLALTAHADDRRAGDRRAPQSTEPSGASRHGSLPVLQVHHGWALQADELLADLGAAERPFVVIHPGSGSPTKNWPAERFARVAASLPHALDVMPILLAGPAEAEAARQVVAAVDLPVPVLRDLPLTVVAGVIRRARAYLGNDSGLTHLAGLLGVPTLALFGPTDPARWAPLGSRVRVLHRQPLDSLGLHEILTELARLAR